MIMSKLFNKAKSISFHSERPDLDIMRPMPTSRFVPNWYRKMDKSNNYIETVKKCVPVLDALTAGYVIPLHSDVFWDSEKGYFISQSKIVVNSDHMKEQTSDVYIPPEFDTQPHKWINTWHVKTPPGYSTLFIHPLNRMDLPFHSFTGIVDTDKHPLVINFPFVIRKDFHGLIPAGTPIIQAIPFKRDDWEMTVNDSDKPYIYPRAYEVDQPPFAWYKRNWWSRKLYS